MGSITRGLLLLLGLGLFVCLLADLSTAQVTDVYLADKEGNRNATVLLGGPEIIIVALVQGDVVDFDIDTDSPLVDRTEGWGGGSDHIEGGNRLHHGFHLLRDAPPGEHVFTFTLNYTLRTNESYHNEYNLTASLVQTIELLDVRITDSNPARLELEVRIHIPCDRISIEYDTDGRIRTTEQSESREDLAPGVYVFGTGLDRSFGLRGSDEDEVGYFVAAVFGNQTIEIVRKNIDPNELMSADGSGAGPIIAVSFVLLLLALLLVAYWMRRRPRAPRVQPAPAKGIRPRT